MEEPKIGDWVYRYYSELVKAERELSLLNMLYDDAATVRWQWIEPLECNEKSPFVNITTD